MSKTATVPTLEPAEAKASDSRLRLDGSMPEVRTAATEALVRTFADALGLKLDGLTVAIDQPAGQSVKARGARGRTLGNLVELDPAGFDPTGASGRALLAHELTHAAQARLAEGIGSPSLRRAEAEADANAMAAGLGRPLLRPLERWTQPALDAGQKSPPKAVVRLESLVAKNYSRELRMIEAILDDLIVTDGEVQHVLRVLEPLAFETAAALVGALGDKARLRLIREVNTGHYDRFRREVIAALAGLTEDDIGQLDEKALADLPFDNLNAPELIAVQRIYHNLPRSAQTELAEGDRKSDIRELRRTVPGEYDAEMARREQALAEEQRSSAVVLGDKKVKARVLDLVSELLRLLESPGAEGAKAALQLIANLNVRMRNDPRNEAEATAPTEAETEELAERAKTEKESPPSPKPNKSEPAKSPPVLSAAALRIIAANLDEADAIDRLIDALPEEARRLPEFREPFRQLVSAREPHRNLALVEDLLDPGWWIFGWVDKHEAMLAYDIVMAMPFGQRDRFRQLEDGKALRRMLDALPRAFRESPDFELPEVARNADGRLIEAERLYAPGGLRGSEAELVGETLTLFREAAAKGDAEDPQARWDRLLAIAQADPSVFDPKRPARADAVLATVVRRLDAEGLLGPFLASLPPAMLAARETWRYAAAIVNARDPVLGRVQIMRLLRESHFLFFTTDSVEPDEAFLAFQLARALPEADRVAIAASEEGEPWARMLDKLSNQTLAEAGYTYFRNAEAAASIRERINDDRLWAAAAHDDQAEGRLIALIELARAAGEFDYVFSYSKLLHDAGQPAPAGITERFRLYDPAAKRLAPEPIEPSLEVGEGSTLTLLFGSAWKEREFRYVTARSRDSLSSGSGMMGIDYEDRSVSHVRLTADLEQLQEVMGGRIHSSLQVAKSNGEREAVTSENRDQLLASTPNIADILLDLQENRLSIRAPKLRLSHIHFIAGGFTLRSGSVEIDDLRLDLDFRRGDLIDLTGAMASLGKLAVDTPVFATASAAAAARRAVLTTLNLGIGDFSGAEMKTPLVGSFFGLALAIGWRQFVSGRSYIDNPLDNAALFDRANISFASFTVDQVQTSGGIEVGQFTVKGARIAAATNRAMYQRLLIRSLQERLDNTTDEGDRALLRQRLAKAEAEKKRLEPLEAEYLRLVRKMKRHDGRLDDDEAERLAELQEAEDLAVGGEGGAIVDVAEITVAGLDGSVRADDFSVKDIHGEGSFRELGGFSLEQLTTEEQLNRFVQFGPEALQLNPQGAARPDKSFTLSLGLVDIGGIVVEAEIPPSHELFDALRELPKDVRAFDPERARLGELASRVAAYELNVAKPEPTDPAQRLAHRRYLMDERRELAELFGGRIGRGVLRKVTLGAFPEAQAEAIPASTAGETDLRKDAGLHIGSAELTDVGYGAYKVDRISGTNLRAAIQLGKPGLEGLKEPGKNLEVAFVGADSLVIDNARIGDSPNRAGKLVIEGFRGTARMSANGLVVENFRIADFSVEDAQYRTASLYLWSRGTTVFSGIEADLTIPFKQVTGEKGDGTDGGEQEDAALSRLDLKNIQVGRLHIATITAGDLGYRGYDAKGGMAKEVVVESGSLRDITIADATTVNPETGETESTRNIAVQTLDGVKFAAKMGTVFQATGTLEEGRKDRGVGQPAISIGFAESGTIDLALDSVDLTRGAVDLRSTSGTGRVLVRKAEISGEFSLEGNTFKVDTLRIPVLDMPSLQWTSKKGGVLKATNAALRQFRLRLDYITESEAKSTVKLHELYVGSFTADSITYDDGPALSVSLSPQFTEEGLQPLIKGLLLQDLTIDMGADSLRMSGGKGRVDQAGFLGVFSSEGESGADPAKHASYATALGRLSVSGFTFEDFGYSEDGVELVGGVESISLDGGGQTGPLDPATAPYGAVTAGGDLSADNGRIGRFRIGNGMISIGPEDSEGLVFDEIVLNGLSFDSGDFALIPAASQAAEKKYEQDPTASAIESEVIAKKLELKMDIHLRQQTEETAAAEGKSNLGAVERIDIRKLHFDSITAQGYRLYLRQMGVYIDIPAGLESTIGPIDLVGPEPDTPFSISFNEAGTKLLGNVVTGPLLARQIGLQMGEGLRARLDFKAKSASLGFLESTNAGSEKTGPIKINLTDWSATNILAYLGEGTSTRIRAGRYADTALTGTRQGIGGQSIDVEMGEDGSLSVKLRKLWARGFELRDQNLGLALIVKKVRMPEDGEIAYNRAPSADDPTNTDHTIDISQLDIDDAYLLILDINAMIAALGGPNIRQKLHSKDRSPDPSAEPDTEASLLPGSAVDWIKANPDLFRSLQGSLFADVQFELGSVTTDLGTLHPQLNTRIENGSIDLDQLEDQLTYIDEPGMTTVATAAANFAFDPHSSEPTLVFGIGGYVPVPPPPGLGGPFTPAEPLEADLHANLYEWNMTSDEMRTIQSTRRIGIDRLLQVKDSKFGEEPDEDEDIPTESIAEQFSGLRVNYFNLLLSTDNEDPIQVSLGGFGSITLPPDALRNFMISSKIQPYNFEPFKGIAGERIYRSLHMDSTSRPGYVNLNLGSLSVSDMALKIPAFGNYAGGSASGAVSINGVEDLSLIFSGLVPEKLSGLVKNVSLTGIKIDLNEIGLYGPEAPTPVFEYDDLPTFEEEGK